MNSDESPAVVELPDDAIKALVEAASGIDIMPELLARVPEAVEYVDAWRKTLIDNGSLREESPTNEFLGVVTIAATWAVNGVIAAHVRAEAVAEHRAEQRHWIEVGQQVEAEKRVAEAERDEYRRNWREAEKRTANAVAEAVVGERQRVAAAIHERGMAYRERIGPAVDQSDWHGRFLYGLFCAEEIALGPAAGSVPVATPEPLNDAALLAKHAAYISRTVTASYPEGMDPELVMRRRVGKIFVESGELGDAIEGWTGENPRKGVYATREDVIKELIDCASASLCAIEYMTGDAGLSVGMVARQVIGNAQRLSESKRDHCEPDSVAELAKSCGECTEDGLGSCQHGCRERPGPVATPTEPIHMHNWDGPCPACASVTPTEPAVEPDLLTALQRSLDEARRPVAASPVPAEQPPTFERLLTDPLEQFDTRSELLPAVLKYLQEYEAIDPATLMRSVEEYRNAPPATASTSHMTRPAGQPEER